VVLDFGRVIATGSPREVQDNPAVTTAYLGTAETGGGSAQ
jgi:branched-chain amino acid transport system ATP-binding protein